MKEGEVISVLGPLGNGFPLDEARGKHVMLMGAVSAFRRWFRLQES